MTGLPRFALGREEKVFIKSEAAYGVIDGMPAGTDAVRHRELTFEQTEERVMRDDKRPTRSFLEQIVRRKSSQFSLGGYLLPSGAAGTPTNGWHAILDALFGDNTVVGGTSVTYSLLKEFSKSFTLHRAIGNGAANAVLAESMRGSVISEATFNFSGEDETTITASGFGADILRAGRSLVVTDSGTVIGVTAGQGPKFDVGQFIDAGAQTDLLISAITNDNLTVQSHPAATAADPVVPSLCRLASTFQADSRPISGILGTSLYDATPFRIISAQVSINNNVQMHNDRYGLNRADGFHISNRNVEGQLVVRLTDINTLEVFKTRSNVKVPLSLTAGTAAGSIFTFIMPGVIFDYSNVPSDVAEDLQVTLPFKAFGGSGEDEILLAMT